MLTYPKSTMRVWRMPMHLSSGHVTLMPGQFYPPPSLLLPNLPQSDLGRRADSPWALPQISSSDFKFAQQILQDESDVPQQIFLSCSFSPWLFHEAQTRRWVRQTESYSGRFTTTNSTTPWFAHGNMVRAASLTRIATNYRGATVALRIMLYCCSY